LQRHSHQQLPHTLLQPLLLLLVLLVLLVPAACSLLH
jgi:hypothetical protein